MKRQTHLRKTSEERQLINIIRRLPGERVSEVIDFARFLESRQTRISENDQPLTAGEMRWETLLASDEAQQLLETMADEAADEILRGQAKPKMKQRARPRKPQMSIEDILRMTDSAAGCWSETVQDERRERR